MAQALPPDGLPAGLSAADWSGIWQAHQANRPSAHAVEGGDIAHNPGELRQTFVKRRSGGVRSDINGRGASFLQAVDAIGQQAYIKASNAELNDGFGQAVALSGNTAVVTAAFEDSSATGVNGSQGNSPLFFADSGAAYVFVKVGSTWSQQAYLKPSNTGFLDLFGESVAISDDTIIVGSQRENSKATGINGNQEDDSLASAGAVYVFVRNGSTWSQQAYLKASNTNANDQFSHSLAISGDTVVVGADLEESSATGVNSTQHDNSAAGAGAAYVFFRSGTTWTQQAYLKASNTEAWDRFGTSVAISNDTVVVGAIGEDSRATGINGNENGNSVPNSGAAYVFVRSGSSWSQEAYIKASNTGQQDSFGSSLAISGNTLAVGADLEESNATGINGDQLNDLASGAGSVYVYTRNGSTWSQQAYLKASNTEGGDRFGTAMALSDSGDQLAVTARDESGGSPGINGDQSDNSKFMSGAVYLFARFGSTWLQRAYVKPSNIDAFDGFGWSVAVSDTMLIAGTLGDDSASTGIGGDPSDNSSLGVGSIFAFDAMPDTWTDAGCALAGVTGDPLLVGTGTLAAGSSNSIDLSNAAPNALSGLFLSLSSTPTPFKGGILKPFPFLVDPIVLTTSPAGTLPLPFVLPPGLPSGTMLWLQYATQDAAAVFGVSLSNALVGVTP